MAITVNSSPASYSSGQDALYHVVTSTNVAQPNFKYVFDVYVAAALVARVKLFPDPTTSKGIFNAEKIVRNYFAAYFGLDNSLTTFNYTTNNIKLDYEIKYGEEYGGTTYTNLVTATYTVANYYNDLFTDPYLSQLSSTSYRWLTNRGLNTEASYNDPLYVPFLSDSDSKNLRLRVRVYNEAGTVLSTTTGANVLCSRLTMLDLCGIAVDDYLLGAGAIITADTYSYGVSVYDGTTYSDEIKIKQVCNARFTPVNITFLNQLGGYESFYFRLVNKRTDNFDRKSYQKLDYTYSSGNMVPIINSTVNAGGVNYAVSKTATMRLSSDYITIAENNWLRELIASTDVYLTYNNYFYPVLIKSSTWEEKVNVADKMVQFNLDVDFGKSFNSQYR